jgi:transcriptional regulator with XRE-family HTH domain
LRTIRERSVFSKELGMRMTDVRASAGVTQVEIARRMKTTQTAIARLESGRNLPSTRTLARFAAAVGRRLVIDFQEIDSPAPQRKDG